MNGYQITFFTHQDNRHKGKQVGEWLVHLAQELGLGLVLGGATLIAGGEGFGHHRVSTLRISLNWRISQ